MSREFLDLVEELKAKDSKFSCEVIPMGKSEMKEGYVHGPSFTEPDHDIVKIAKKYADEITGDPVPVKPFPAWADAGLLNTYKQVPVIIMGPGFMECCHALDERIPVAHFHKAALIYALTAVEFCGTE